MLLPYKLEAKYNLFESYSENSGYLGYGKKTSEKGQHRFHTNDIALQRSHFCWV